MKFHYKKQFNGDLDSLPKHPHESGAVKFKEPDDMKRLSIILNIISFSLFFVLLVLDYTLYREFDLLSISTFLGLVLSVVVSVPHEFLHGICFKGDVDFYTALDKGMMFVTGTESFSKARFVFMSLLPNIIFGFIPWILGLIFQDWPISMALVSLGTFAIAQGAGDYYNVYHAITQMPKGSRCYMSGMNTYWYIPNSKHQK